jgi:hypothetical protein
MRDYLNIGSSPASEDCAQVGSDGYHKKAKKECGVFIGQIRRELGPEPPGASLSIKSFPHDFGNYMEVVCYFDDESEAAREYAFKCEAECPDMWDEEAKKELGMFEVCPHCDRVKKLFIHHCPNSINAHEIVGCPECDDECPECR